MLWIGTQIINKDQLEVIHRRIEKVKIPIQIGRLPSNISSGVTFTAEQWINWTLYFSVYCLNGILSSEEMECWRHFVLAARRLCKRSVNSDDITVADALLLQFGKRIKR